MRKRYIIGGACAIVLILAVTGAGVYAMRQHSSVVPSSIKNKLNATLLLPEAEGTTVIQKSSIKYDDSLQLLSFNVNTAGTTLVVSEQPMPESFTDIPQAYDKVVSGMNEYTKFETDGGTVHLTRPKNLEGKQAAVLSSKGTLLFAKPANDLTDQQWRRFFNTLNVVK